MTIDPYWCETCQEHHAVPSIARIHEGKKIDDQ